MFFITLDEPQPISSPRLARQSRQRSCAEIRIKDFTGVRDSWSGAGFGVAGVFLVALVDEAEAGEGEHLVDLADVL